MSEHSHVMGGSNAKRRIMCPGSLAAEKAMPDSPASEFALRGSLLHSCMQLLLTDDPNDMDDAEPLLLELTGQVFEYGPEFAVTEELIEEKIRPALAAWFEIRDRYGFKDWIIEERVSLESILPGAFGTADVLAIDRQQALHTIDWKFGDGVMVSARENFGLGFYAAGALYDEDPELKEMFAEVGDGIYLHIIQPMTGRAQVLDTWQTNMEWINGLVDLIEATQGQTSLKAGDWCMFCKAQALCPEFNAHATRALSLAPQSMDAVQLATALHMADALDAWIAAVKKLALDEARSGAAIPGFKLVNKQPRRVWTDAAKAEKILRARHRVPKIFKRELISPTQAEKLDKALYKSKLAELVVYHSTGTTLAPDDDKRQAVSSAAAVLAAVLPPQ